MNDRKIFPKRMRQAVMLFIIGKRPFQFFDAGQLTFDVLGKCFGQFIFRNADRFADILQSIFRHDPVFVLAKQQTDRGRIAAAFHLTVDRGHIKTQLSQVLRFEFTRFEFTRLEKKYGFTVPSTSIDLCGHLNNVEYLRFVLNATSAETEIFRPVREIEINFVAQACEGEKLTLFGGECGANEFFEIKSGEMSVARCRVFRGG